MTLSLTYLDGMTNELALYEAASADAPVLLIFPALGVRASYYSGLAEAFQAAGWHVCVADYRGTGKTSVRASRRVDFGYETLLEDATEVWSALRKRHPDSPRYLLGHSLGGQIGSLLAARQPNLLDGLILLASCLVDWRGWPKGKRTRTRLAVNLFPLIARIWGYFPGKTLGFGGREARTLMQDWGHSGRTGRYELSGSLMDDEAALAKLKQKTLAITLAGDGFCPRKASENLYRKFHPESDLTHHHLTGKEMDPSGLDHFRWVRFPEVIVERVGAWR
jgi:predicted alpha/beta hydrolase